MTLKIIFQNENFVVLDKPAMALSVPSRLGERDERPVVGHLLQTQLGAQIFPCHRLDFEVSGLLLYALNARAHGLANKWFERRKVKKIYYAMSGGDLSSFEKFKGGELWKSKIVRGKKRSFEADHGDPAETFVRTLEFDEALGLKWKLEPITGRSHQLRFEMAKHGFPIDGDVLYGSQRPFACEGIALRASEIHFNQVAPEELLGMPAFFKI
jgi:tRNA pseudouridine32 synthase/23S rRNA pseudouridine746 synthase